jgi:hypothetical protein
VDGSFNFFTTVTCLINMLILRLDMVGIQEPGVRIQNVLGIPYS